MNKSVAHILFWLALACACTVPAAAAQDVPTVTVTTDLVRDSATPAEPVPGALVDYVYEFGGQDDVFLRNFQALISLPEGMALYLRPQSENPYSHQDISFEYIGLLIYVSPLIATFNTALIVKIEAIASGSDPSWESCDAANLPQESSQTGTLDPEVDLSTAVTHLCLSAQDTIGDVFFPENAKITLRVTLRIRDDEPSN